MTIGTGNIDVVGRGGGMARINHVPRRPAIGVGMGGDMKGVARVIRTSESGHGVLHVARSVLGIDHDAARLRLCWYHSSHHGSVAPRGYLAGVHPHSRVLDHSHPWRVLEVRGDGPGRVTSPVRSSRLHVEV